jgi:cytoskeleton protein RodZ
MDTFGEILRSSREKKGYSLEQVARDTNIARKFLTALEEEDLAIFPGDPYLIGFLKNYSEYLGLDPDELVALHRNMKLQEQPVPIEELLDTGKSRAPVFIILILLVVALGAVGYYLFDKLIQKSPETIIDTVVPVEIPKKIISYSLSAVELEDRFPEDSELQIQFNNDLFSILIKTVSSKVILSLPGGEDALSLGDEKFVDLNDDGSADLTIILKDIDINKKTAVLKLKGIVENIEESESAEVLIQGESNIASRNRDKTVIMESSFQDPFILNVVFRGNTLVRYIADKGERIERYFDKGEIFRIDIKREVMLWISNAGSFKAKISGKEVDLGQTGEVSSHLIKWISNTDSGKYELQLIPVY